MSYSTTNGEQNAQLSFVIVDFVGRVRLDWKVSGLMKNAINEGKEFIWMSKSTKEKMNF